LKGSDHLGNGYIALEDATEVTVACWIKTDQQVAEGLEYGSAKAALQETVSYIAVGQGEVSIKAPYLKLDATISERPGNRCPEGASANPLPTRA
jgi:hypothetical protein